MPIEMNSEDHDYADDGISVQTAMLRAHEANPVLAKKKRYIIWGGLKVYSSYLARVPKQGALQIEFLSPPVDPMNGIDICAEGGGIKLANGEMLEVLRTWHDPEYEPVVRHEFHAPEGALYVWNVARHTWPSGRTSDEKWSGNLGLSVEQESPSNWLFQCSGIRVNEQANFQDLVFRLTIEE